jgi:hypothetical protein
LCLWREGVVIVGKERERQEQEEEGRNGMMRKKRMKSQGRWLRPRRTKV